MKKSHVYQPVKNDNQTINDITVCKPFLKQNYTNYFNEPQMIGFMKSFPEKIGDTIDTLTINTTCLGVPVQFNVRYGKVTFGKKNEFDCAAIITDVVRVADKLRNGGFGSHCYVDEAKTMEDAVIKMAAKHNLMICEKVCSWPFAKAIVQPVYATHIKNFNEDHCGDSVNH